MIIHKARLIHFTGSAVHPARDWSLDWRNVILYLSIAWLIVAVLLLLGILLYKYMYRSNYGVLP